MAIARILCGFARRQMRSLQIQFFLMFGSIAVIQPFIAVYLKDRGLSDTQVGYLVGISGWAIVLSPVCVTLLADTRVQPRRLLGGLSLFLAASVGALMFVGGYWALAACYFLYSLGSAAMAPLQDGVAFGVQKMFREQGRTPFAYSEIRVWGTYGYVAFLMLAFLPMWLGFEVVAVFGIGVLAFLAVLLNTLRMPDRGARETAKRAGGLPTGAALRALFNRRMTGFTIAMFCLLCASSAYHTLYPVFLVETLGLPRHWMSVVVMSGAVLEIFCILALPRLQERFGVSRVMLGGVALAVLRFALMYSVPNLTVAVGSQLLHGAMIVSMMVIPPSVVNACADDRTRNSIQGLYVMLVVGFSRFVGTAASGHVSAVGDELVYLFCSLLCVVALALLWDGKWAKGAPR